ncbi:MAG: low specificity L-threonine aldolase [Clostridia bacterium]|nr:low specificity L-threonine aldolase [Clostridia bacterium]
MIRFDCDYLEGAHERIIRKLTETNMEQTIGYGCDPHCERAATLIKEACKRQDSDVHFLVGGTQTNATVISAALRTHQGVISAQTGHINVHESGAIEAGGHKVLSLPSDDGKLSASQVKECIDSHWSDPAYEHMVQPAMVYISQPTERGTLYTKSELEALYCVCKEYKIPLYIDGARLGYALASDDCDMSLSDVAANCDAFYIGGTKVGALFGEALIINNESLKKDFRYIIKQQGGLLAKGRLLGIQFEALFEDGLYFEISAHAIKAARKIKEIFVSHGCEFLSDSSTNQQFPILENEEIEKLSKDFSFEYWCAIDEHKSAVRFCSSWATTNENIETLKRAVEKL